MHYKNGREVKIGDMVVGRGYDNNPISGVVVAAQDTNPNTCQMSVVPVTLNNTLQCLATDQFLHVDDALPVTVAETAEPA